MNIKKNKYICMCVNCDAIPVNSTVSYTCTGKTNEAWLGYRKNDTNYLSYFPACRLRESMANSC